MICFFYYIFVLKNESFTGRYLAITFNTLISMIMNLKVLFLTLFAALILGNPCYARDEEQQLNLQNVGYHGDHFEHYDPIDMPEAYYDNEDNEIIIVGDGYSSYYEVEIISLTTMVTWVDTTISGYGDTINVSSLPNDSYKIIITSSYNNTFEGTFTIY